MRLYQGSGGFLNKGEVLLQDGHQKAAGAESREQCRRCRRNKDKQVSDQKEAKNKFTAWRLLTRMLLNRKKTGSISVASVGRLQQLVRSNNPKISNEVHLDCEGLNCYVSKCLHMQSVRVKTTWKRKEIK